MKQRRHLKVVDGTLQQKSKSAQNVWIIIALLCCILSIPVLPFVLATAMFFGLGWFFRLFVKGEVTSGFNFGFSLFMMTVFSLFGIAFLIGEWEVATAPEIPLSIGIIHIPVILTIISAYSWCIALFSGWKALVAIRKSANQ